MPLPIQPRKYTMSATRHEESAVSASNRFPGSVNFFNIPNTQKETYYKPQPNSNVSFNIIPFVIGPNNPMVHSGKLKVGDLDIILDVYVHTNLGPEGRDKILCPKMNYGKPCCLCEESLAFKNAGKKDEAMNLMAKRRSLANIQIEGARGMGPIQIHESAFGLFYEKLAKFASLKGKCHPVPFSHPVDGKIICGTPVPGKKFAQAFEWTFFDFADRREEVTDELIESAFQFDKYLVHMTNDEIQKYYFGNGEEETPAPEHEQEVEQGEVTTEQEHVPNQPNVPETASQHTGNKCPQGHVYGEDTYKYPDCKGCSKLDKCIG